MAEPVLPEGMTPQALQEWLADNPKGSPQDAIRSYINWRAKDEGVGPGEMLLKVYPGLGGQQPPAGAQLGSPGFAGGAVPFQGQPAMSGQDVIRTARDAALMAASGPVSTIGKGVLGVGARTLAMGGAGAAAGAATEALPGGEGAGTGAIVGGLIGAGGQLVGETTKLATNLLSKKFWGEHLATFGNRVKWARRDADRAMVGIMEDVPAFQSATLGSTDSANFLMRLTQKPTDTATRNLGKELLGGSIQGVENTVITSLGGLKKEINVPTLWKALASPDDLQRYGQVHTGALPIPGQTTSTPSKLLGPTGQPLPPTTTVTPGSPGVRGVVVDVVPPMTVKDALEGLKTLTEQAIDSGHGHSAKVIWEKVAKSRAEILAGVPPDVAARYTKSLHDYSKGLTILDALQGSKALTGPLATGKRANFDAEAFLDHLQAKEAYGYVPKVVNRLHAGGDLGARDQITSMPRGRIYKLGESATFSLPGIRTETRGGSTLPNRRGAGLVGTNLGITGLSELMSTGKGPSPATGYTVE